MDGDMTGQRTHTGITVDEHGTINGEVRMTPARCGGCEAAILEGQKTDIENTD